MGLGCVGECPTQRNKATEAVGVAGVVGTEWMRKVEEDGRERSGGGYFLRTRRGAS